jgi:ADP-ribose pyrophosphatase YjhB (NUDIX family)
MYKIYINDQPLWLVDTATGMQQMPGSEKKPVAMYFGKTRHLLNFVDMMEKNHDLERVTLFHKEPEKLFEDFCSLFKWVEAAGGVVINPEGEVLAIYRLEMWDLPKGKFEKKESPAQCALREVEEETGISGLKLVDFLCHTYHTYQEKGKRVLKKTHWFKMEAPKQELIPQTEENIEKAVWIDQKEFSSGKFKMYHSIQEVLEELE